MYSAILIFLYLTNVIITGVDFEREGTEIEKHIILFGMIWYSFDFVLKYLDGVNSVFVWIHHTCTILSMFALYQREDTLCYGATALFLNDAIYVFLVYYRTLERINYPFDNIKYQINFCCLVVTFVGSRVIGNHWLIYKFAMSSNVHPLIILGSCPIVCFGTIISLKMLIKFWKYIPYWCPDPEKIQQNYYWKLVRSVFQSYRNKGSFSRKVNV